MIFLCDYYNQASKDLAYSLQAAGYDATTVVINPDGFLPQGALSPFTYYVEAEEETGKPRFFNQVPVPAFWEISGNNQMARVSNLTEERARIIYPEGSKARIVKSVEWLDKSGKIRQVDHYNKYGFCLPRPLMMRMVRHSLPATKPKKATNVSWKIISPVIFS